MLGQRRRFAAALAGRIARTRGVDPKFALSSPHMILRSDPHQQPMTAGFADRLHCTPHPFETRIAHTRDDPTGADARATPLPNGIGRAAGASSGLLTDKRALNGPWKQKHLAARGCSLASRPPARTAAPLNSRCRPSLAPRFSLAMLNRQTCSSAMGEVGCCIERRAQLRLGSCWPC